jgi:hypothetical protein
VNRAALSHHFAEHHGVIHRHQATALGLTRAEIGRLLRSGQWLRVHHAVYRLTAFPFGPESCLAAACLAAGCDGAASHESAL